VIEPNADSDSSAADELIEALVDRLGPEAGSGGFAQRRVEALRAFRARRLRRRPRSGQLDPDIAALFGLILPEPFNLEDLDPQIVGIVEQGLEQGLSREALPAVFQAYVRAVNRIASAEATVIGELLTDTPSADQATVVGEALDSLLPLGSRGFDVLHRLILLDALLDVAAGIKYPEAERDLLAVAMVDLVGSTRYLNTASVSDLEQLVDALFEAGQTATASRAAHVMKYEGDGMFVVGREVADVADAALEVIARLELALPLRARAGLAAGPVVQRAGDVFGLAINLAHLASKAARPGTLIATEPAAAQLQSARRGRYRVVRMPHPAILQTRVATIRPQAST
jgi:class 3 adenylate cyclase